MGQAEGKVEKGAFTDGASAGETSCMRKAQISVQLEAESTRSNSGTEGGRGI